MSVPVPNRDEGELRVNTQARALAVYTIKILVNEKWFPKEQERYIQKLQDCAIEIAVLCWEANEIKVNGNAEMYYYRMELQNRAASLCNRFLCMIEIAKPLFHLTSKRVRHWVRETRKLRDLIRGWHEENATRLKPKEVQTP